MQIQPFFSCKINKLKNDFNNTKVLNREITNDTFVKSTSFGSNNDDKSFEAFSQWAEKTNFTDKAIEIINETGKILGDGFEGTTYSIPNNEQWVIKQFKRTNYIQQSLKKPEIKKVKDISPDLNIGQIIASVKIPLNNRFAQHFYVLKKQTGESYGVPHSSKDIVSDSTSKKHIDSLRKMAQLPISTYEQLIDDITYINKRGYKIDADNPYNFMVDWNNKRINFVDIADKLEEKNAKQYGDVLFALLDADFGFNFNLSDRAKSEKDVAKLYSMQICSKFLSSMIRKHVKFDFSSNLSKLLVMQPFEQAIGFTRTDKKLEKLQELGLY